MIDAKTLQILRDNPGFDKPVAELVELLASEFVRKVHGESRFVIEHKPGQNSRYRVDRTIKSKMKTI